MATRCGITKERAKRFVARKVREIDRARKGDEQVWEADDFVELLLNWRQVGDRPLSSDETEALERAECSLGKRGVIAVARSAGANAIRKHGEVRR